MIEAQVYRRKKSRKNRLEKRNIRIDFTPMVDMNMLLITFFMLCTTFLKTQTMNINMPSKNGVLEEKKNRVRKSGTITLILGGGNEIYYYVGVPNFDNPSFNEFDFLVTSSYGMKGIRQLLLHKNTGIYEKIRNLKIKLRNQEITEEEFRENLRRIQQYAFRVKKTTPVVIIKPTELSTYENLVDVLDEMLVCNIDTYTVVDMTDQDRYLLYRKTLNSEYLTKEQRLKINH